jgi:adenosine deaminase
MMHRDFGFSATGLRQCMLNGLQAAWIDEATRRRWTGEFTEGFDAAVASALKVLG